MLQYYIVRQKFSFIFMMLVFASMAGHTQIVSRAQPVWWFGESVAANVNEYIGTTQVLNQSVTVPTAFHKGNGVRPYASLLTEYRPNKVWGGMLNIAFDNRGGKFKEVIASCNCPADLSTNISYLAIEPSVRLAPFKSAFYIFAGPTIDINLSKEFTYKQFKVPDLRGDWSDIHKTAISAQAGAGIDIPISNITSTTQVTLSPFASFQTDLFEQPRSSESWSIYTIRAGVALKFGVAKKSTPVVPVASVVPATAPVIVMEKEVQFSVRAPRVATINRQVKETFPLLNSVFFDRGVTVSPNRYVLLTPEQASSFKEEQAQQGQPANLNKGRSVRQLAVYHNVLNILGDRMRANPTSSITLIGSADNNPKEGKEMAENIKAYLVADFGIETSRIITEGRDKPLIPTEQTSVSTQLALFQQDDRRVDIVSNSPELLMQVGGNTSPFLKPVEISAVQEDPLDRSVIFNAGGASDLLESWSVDVTDEMGNVQHFGPYTQDQASVSGKAILGDNVQGNYTIVMTGQTKSGHSIRKESSVSLMKMDDPKQDGLRYSILFNFDKSKTIASYEKFLTDIIAPLIPENATVIIHGHTDIIGEEKYNLTLSNERAKDAQQIIEHALSNSGKRGVIFESIGFGEDTGIAPFENNLPEERFYNRTVIIDIIPAK